MSWRQATDFRADSDRIFASPVKLGKLLYSYPGCVRNWKKQPKLQRLGHISTHSFRHSIKSWLSALGIQLDVTKELMRHSIITMTMDGYGALLGNDAAATTSQRSNCRR